jgi:AcrR family transcriptional regulator
MTKRTKEEVIEEFRCASIQAAAMSVIARKGVADATMQDIAEEAGIAKGTLYVYFRDRDELLAKTAGHAYDRLIAELDDAFEAPGTLGERLTEVVLRQLQFFDIHRELFHAYIALSQREGGDARLRKSKMSSYGRYLQRLEKVFSEAKERGEVRDFEPRELAAMYADCVRGVVVRRIEEKLKTPREQQAAMVVSMMLQGIGARS